MKGMELCERYWRTFGEGMMKEQFPDLLPRIAVGLAGSGSECLGYDDELSRDHDFEVGFCLFLPRDIDSRRAFALERAYAALPSSFEGIARPRLTPAGGSRRGVIWQEDFLRDRTGRQDGHVEGVEWLHLPEQALLEASGGRIFRDDSGAFSAVRRHLAFLPEDVRRKKLAGCFLLMGQAGLYNLPRCLARGEEGAARLALHEFVMQAAHAVFLLHSAYMPYYKWRLRALGELGQMGAEFAAELRDFLLSPVGGVRIEKAETLCAKLIHELKNRKLSLAEDDFLASHGLCLQEKISDPFLSSLPAQAMI